MNGSSTRVAAILAVTWILFVSFVYLPDLGRGFVKDDFAWITASRDAVAHPARLFVLDAPGFFRPVVAASFAADYVVHGLNARGYGFTNLLLFVGCLAGLMLVCRALKLSMRATALAVFVWSVNPHGINMAIIWISGRSALLLTLFSLLATAAFLQGHRTIGALLLFGALLSKEEATVLPVVLLLWLWLLRPDWSRRDVAFDALALALPVAAYAAMRMQTPAFTPGTAPWFYRFTMTPAAVTRNVLEYLDRGAMMGLIVLVLSALVLRARPQLTTHDKRVLAAAGIWFCGGYAITVWLPIRSSLYAVFPAVGSAVACATLIDAMRPDGTASGRPVRLALVLTSVLLIIPVYRARDTRFVEPARVSQRTLRTITAQAGAIPMRGLIVLEDESGTKSNFVNAFGTLAPEAIRLFTGRPLDARIVPPDEARGWSPNRAPVQIAAHYRLTKGRVERQ